MKILAIETTGANASVAIIDEKKRISDKKSEKKMSHLQNLIPMVDALLIENRLAINHVTHIAISEGPGSFTGIRIGMATGKALAQVLDIPVIGVPTLAGLSWNVKGFDGLICPILDARRNQVYGGAYRWENKQNVQVIKDEAWELSEFLKYVDEHADKNEKILFLGDGIDTYKYELIEWGLDTKRLSSKDDSCSILPVSEHKFQKASSVASAALEIIRSGGEKDFEKIRPVYLRVAEAERKLKQNLEKASLGDFK